jgi:uncharacterized coiled-coil protein SlyX
MSMREREGLIARVRQIRRVAEATESSPALIEEELTDPARFEALEARIAHLEELLEGLQDSVYREAQRSERRLTELETKVEPSALAEALSKDARERGL